MLSIRCPHCDVAFQVAGDDPQAEVRCGNCGSRLGTLADGETHIDQPLDLPLVATLVGHTGQVWSLAFSPDGRTLASGSIDGTVKLWDPSTGAVQATLTGPMGGVRAVAISPDGAALASGSQDHTVRLWDLASQTERVALRGYTDSSLAFSPDGRLLATGSVDDTVRLWEVGSGRELPPLRVRRNSVRAVAFSPDGRMIALGHFVGSGVTLQLWDLGTRSVRLMFGGQENVTAVCFSPDGQTLASADLAGQIMLWDPATGAERALLMPLGRNQYFRPFAVLSLAFSPAGSFLAAGLYLQGGPNVQVWDLDSGKVRAALKAHRDGVQCVAFSPDGTTLATASRDKTIKLWRLPRPDRLIASMSAH